MSALSRCLTIFGGMVLAFCCTASGCWKEAKTCTHGRTLVDDVCVSLEVADYVACVRAKGAEIGEDKSTKLAAEVKTAGASASAASEVKNSVERRYAAASDALEAKVLEQCARFASRNSPQAVASPAPAPSSSEPKPEDKAAAAPAKPKDLDNCTRYEAKGRSLYACVLKANWNEANTYCKQSGLELVSIADAEENAELSGMMRGKLPSFYVGLSEIGERNRYQWTDGTTFAFSSFWAGEPSKVGMYNEEERCVEFVTDRGLWNDSACGNYSRGGFVCATKRATPRTVKLDGFACERKAWNGNNYVGCVMPVSWYTARSMCRDIGMDLASVRSPEENQFLWQWMSARSGRFVLGFNDIASKGMWTWSNGAGASFTSWKPGQPDHWVDGDGNEEHCSEITAFGQWNDIRCMHEQVPAFVCKSL